MAVADVQRGSTKGLAWHCGRFGVAAACFHETIRGLFWHRQGANSLIEKNHPGVK